MGCENDVIVKSGSRLKKFEELCSTLMEFVDIGGNFIEDNVYYTIGSVMDICSQLLC